jgi:hypothetical protein
VTFLFTDVEGSTRRWDADAEAMRAALAAHDAVLRAAVYESLARKGQSMTIAAIVTYAFDEIERARSELNAAAE